MVRSLNVKDDMLTNYSTKVNVAQRIHIKNSH